MSIKKLTLSLFVIVGAVISMPSQSAILFSDNFDTDSTSSALNFNSLTNWTVSNGTTDYVRSGDFGISCVGGSGGCLDMDGSSGNAGRIVSRATFTILPGVNYFLSADVSGNQRGGASDSITWGFADIDGVPQFQAIGNRASDAPFSPILGGFNYGLELTVRLFFEDSNGQDNVGVILDNVVFSDDTVGKVPEPSVLALLGLGLAGLAGCRRRK